MDLFDLYNSESDAKKRMEELISLLNYHSDLYYNQQAPEISDAEYDELFRELERIEANYPHLKREDSPTSKVGFEIEKNTFAPVKYKVKMLSLSNIFSESDLSDFLNRIRNRLNLATDSKVDIFAEYKIDGVSCNIRYEKGILVLASTRGDGSTGEDITLNVKQIKNVPHELKGAIIPDVLEVRGEVFMFDKDFDQMNEEQIRNQDKIFANSRNATSGSLRQIDPQISGKRPLSFFAYALGEFSSDLEIKSQMQYYNMLQDWGFDVVPESKLLSTEDEILKFYNEAMAKRDDLGFQIDGIVYKVDDFELQSRLGFVSRSPRWATAHKFPAQEKTTKLEDIQIQVGRTGTLNPVAKLKPVHIGGVVVSRATLHNIDYIEALDIRPGDTVFVLRAGDVIPKVTALAKKAEPRADKFKFPDKCPVCGHDVDKVVNEDSLNTTFVCPNKWTCRAQLEATLKYFVSKDNFDIENLGDSFIKLVLERGYVSKPADLYKLKDYREELVQIEGYKDKSIDNILNNIEKRKKISLPRFISGLGISLIGRETAIDLAKYYKSLDNLINALKTKHILEDFAAANNKQPKKYVENLLNFVEKENGLQIIQEFIDAGLEIQDYEIAGIQENEFKDKVVVLTGSLTTLKRAEAKDILNSLGAKVSNSISKKTDILIVGESAGSKLKKAEELGIKIMTEQEFLEKK